MPILVDALEAGKDVYIEKPLTWSLDENATVLGATVGRAGAQLPIAPERLALIVLATTDGASVERLIDPERADGQLMAEMFGWIAAGLLANQTGD